ncbi:phytoene dehydrogenase-like protein [Stackebrandtia albiflava]|uniref:Pyridine nucleotide-disulfide oxidoreductase domain-containing protein 2 n=1 Tax=Stackebrandtia albiflava TaxID=406432 RepID=A0A562V9V2_9ACTN|nr:phytoene dehydrogenase-like protein [Stackebrandtia albiflava]
MLEWHECPFETRGWGVTTTADAVVIGAGHNGLVAANMLADAGWDVVVLEATPYAGGAVRTAEVAAEGVPSDLCSSFYPFGAASTVLQSLGLTDYGLRWVSSPAALAHVMPDRRVALLSRSPEGTAESVAEYADADGQAWLDLYDQWRRVSLPLRKALFQPFPPVRPALSLLARLGTPEALRLVRRLLLPVRELGEELFRGEGARVLLTGNALHSDVSPEGAGSGVFGWLLAMIGQEFGFPAAAGGAQSITDALLRRLAAGGGRVVLEAPVERVIVGGGKALGVRTADGRAWRARRAVLADVPALTLYRELVGTSHLPARMVSDLAGFRYDRPILKLDWALNSPVPWKDHRLGLASTVHIGGDTAGLTRSAAALAAGDDPAEPFVLFGQPDVADPGRSRPGTEAAWAYTHLPQRYAELSAGDERIAAYVERIEARLADLAPGFRSTVIGRYVQGPKELYEKNPSMVCGALGAGTSSLGQQLIFRPVPGLGRADTPVERLYLASAAAHPGGGVHGVPGANAARSALHAAGPVTGALYRAAIRGAHRLVY